MNRRTITFHFTLKDAAGRLLDTSRGGEPMPFTEGTGQIIDGLEAELVQMAPGEIRVIVVPPERAYGLPDPGLVQRIPRDRLPVDDLRVGDRFQTGPDRHAPLVTVLALEGDQVLLDANHPLAGQELHFEVELVTVRAATQEELHPAGNPT
jgi:FKBP-type peptidyl-prolyl cis-trans isomerase SlyD